jgi:hypothetical protein
MGRRIVWERSPEPPAVTVEPPLPAEQVTHARNAIAELRALLRTVKSTAIRETVEFSLAGMGGASCRTRQEGPVERVDHR